MCVYTCVSLQTQEQGRQGEKESRLLSNPSCPLHVSICCLIYFYLSTWQMSHVSGRAKSEDLFTLDLSCVLLVYWQNRYYNTNICIENHELPMSDVTLPGSVASLVTGWPGRGLLLTSCPACAGWAGRGRGSAAPRTRYRGGRAPGAPPPAACAGPAPARPQTRRTAAWHSSLLAPAESSRRWKWQMTINLLRVWSRQSPASP